MLIPAFIFNDESSESVTLMNNDYDENCSRNETIANKVQELKAKYENIKRLSRRELEFSSWLGIEALCETKRDIARTMTYWIQPIANICVENDKKRKEFVLNTLLLLEASLDYFCGMNLSHVESNLGRCLVNNAQLLTTCVSKSYSLYFWESTPVQPPTLIQLLNGSVCK